MMQPLLVSVVSSRASVELLEIIYYVVVRSLDNTSKYVNFRIGPKRTKLRYLMQHISAVNTLEMWTIGTGKATRR